MPKQRLTCTRCSQRRQKCDRKTPCSRCIQNKEAHLCTTQWVEGYIPSVHRRYPRKPSIGRSTTGTSETSSTLNASPPVQEDPASTDPIIGPSFAIGQSKFLDITIGSLLNDKDVPAREPNLFDQSLRYVRSAGKQVDVPNRIASFCSPTATSIEMQHVQSLVPDRVTMFRVVDYYYDYMLYWAGGFYHGPSFRGKLVEAYGNDEVVDVQKLDWRWNALLFAILSASVIGSPESLTESWGISIDDKVKLARLWGAASVTCLNLGSYTSQYHIHSVQAIYILHAYEHLAGSTNQWIALRSVAVVIARGLGLHRLTAHPDDAKVAELDAVQKQAFIDREIGRRVWASIASQEWLCSTSQSNFNVTIQKRQFTTTRPMDLDEDTMLPLKDDNTPSFTLVGRYFYDYAGLLLDFHNKMLDSLDAVDSVRYAMILKFDGDMRATCAEKVPQCLNSRTPLQPHWPKWVKWARTLHQASVNHKIIMLHQSFLSKSFKDPRYTYTRWACATAAKNVINLYTVREPEEPQWWVEQAFVVTAGICLMLDLFHRSGNDPEAHGYQTCVQHAIRYLQQFFTSSVSGHGVRLLMSLLQEYTKLHEGTRPGTAPSRLCLCVPVNLVDTPVHEKSHEDGLPMDPDVPLSNEEVAQFNFDIDTLAFEDLMDYLPIEGGLDGNVIFESIYGLSSGT